MSRETEDFYTRYWAGLIAYMRARGIALEQRSHSKEARQIIGTTWASGKIRIAAGLHRPAREAHSIHVDVTMDMPMAKRWFAYLQQYEPTIKREVGMKDGRWEWNLRIEQSESHIILRRLAHPDDERSRLEKYEWFAEKLVAFHDAFRPRIDEMLTRGELGSNSARLYPFKQRSKAHPSSVLTMHGLLLRCRLQNVTCANPLRAINAVAHSPMHPRKLLAA